MENQAKLSKKSFSQIVDIYFEKRSKSRSTNIRKRKSFHLFSEEIRFPDKDNVYNPGK